MERILFETANKIKWVQKIASIVNQCESEDNDILLDFDECIAESELKPFHLTSLACLIQFLIDKEYSVSISRNNCNVCNYICEDCGFLSYWKLGMQHAKSKADNIFSLWKIIDGEKDIFASEVTNYFKNIIKGNKDFTPISTTLAEAYNNVFDHANAKGNAFSVIAYNDRFKKINVAICDFGISIPNSVCAFLGKKITDTEALEISMRKNFTTQSQKNNRGFGLDNILTNSDNVRVFSKSAYLIKIDGKQQTFPLDFEFRGTLIDFDIDVPNLEEEDVLTDFEF
nr:MAG TPA: hypothetical protein [Caudoviricetes sp.]